MKKILIIFLLTFSIHQCWSQQQNHGKSLKIVRRTDRGVTFLIPVITLGFDGKQWVFSSGDYTNVTADVIFEEVKKADEIKHVANGYGLIIPRRFSVLEASSYYELAPTSGYYLMYAQVQGSKEEVSNEQMLKEYINVIKQHNDEFGNWDLEQVYEKIRQREKNSNQNMEPMLKTPGE